MHRPPVLNEFVLEFLISFLLWNNIPLTGNGIAEIAKMARFFCPTPFRGHAERKKQQVN